MQKRNKPTRSKAPRVLHRLPNSLYLNTEPSIVEEEANLQLLPLLQLFPSLGLPELLVILFIIILLFGSKKLPELAKSLGDAVRQYRKSSSGIEETEKAKDSETEKIDSLAKSLGIKTEGRTKEEILDDISKTVERSKKLFQ